MDEAVFQEYLEGWRTRQKQAQRRQLLRWRRARQAARKLARLLMREYGAREVYLFGSLLRPHRFHEGSDIDLAAAGLSPLEYFRTLSRLNEVTGFAVDLVDLDACPPHLETAIRTEGEPLGSSPRDGGR